jgi:hypothetical protein
MKEAFATIKPYHKQLEDFFKAMNSNGHRFFYERRPHQYDDDESVLNIEIVSAPLLIKSFVSVVIEEPHKVHFYYGQILRDYNNDDNTLLFVEDHHPGLYFVSHLLASKAKEVSTRAKVSSWSYHVALLIKKILDVNLNVHDKYTDERIRRMIQSVQLGLSDAANKAVDLVKQMNFGRDENMIPENTQKLLGLLGKEKVNQYIELSKASVMKKEVEPIKFSGANKTTLADGKYRVNNLKYCDGYFGFEYGPSLYSIIGSEGLNIEQKSSTCNIILRNGCVIKIDD